MTSRSYTQAGRGPRCNLTATEKYARKATLRDMAEWKARYPADWTGCNTCPTSMQPRRECVSCDGTDRFVTSNRRCPSGYTGMALCQDKNGDQIPRLACRGMPAKKDYPELVEFEDENGDLVQFVAGNKRRDNMKRGQMYAVHPEWMKTNYNARVAALKNAQRAQKAAITRRRNQKLGTTEAQKRQLAAAAYLKQHKQYVLAPRRSTKGMGLPSKPRASSAFVVPLKRNQGSYIPPSLDGVGPATRAGSRAGGFDYLPLGKEKAFPVRGKSYTEEEWEDGLLSRARKDALAGLL